jgi:hypothetical protein
MFLISLGGISELVLLGWWTGLRSYYTLKLSTYQRLIVGWKPEEYH